MDETDMVSLFSSFGRETSYKVIKDEDGISKGNGRRSKEGWWFTIYCSVQDFDCGLCSKERKKLSTFAEVLCAVPRQPLYPSISSSLLNLLQPKQNEGSSGGLLGVSPVQEQRCLDMLQGTIDPCRQPQDEPELGKTHQYHEANLEVSNSDQAERGMNLDRDRARPHGTSMVGFKFINKDLNQIEIILASDGDDKANKIERLSSHLLCAYAGPQAVGKPLVEMLKTESWDVENSNKKYKSWMAAGTAEDWQKNEAATLAAKAEIDINNNPTDLMIASFDADGGASLHVVNQRGIQRETEMEGVGSGSVPALAHLRAKLDLLPVLTIKEAASHAREAIEVASIVDEKGTGGKISVVHLGDLGSTPCTEEENITTGWSRTDEFFEGLVDEVDIDLPAPETP
ncbi:OLC1v1012510C1 [Oldenlandia corymbosa var. corymbosa]|uniref:OLC1v1012510C1 n=1 Tax=Oldenlandia corymbosa var. corymbosa TaxID=529605 RepID=A0AAV1DW64_OLDCO|nr:OLC1v1012510C1 [Oldenlandia corymbosa var. corymbosa]